MNKKKTEDLEGAQLATASQQQQQGEIAQRAIGSMQRKLFEAQKANQDAFHARETLVQPEEQLDNNDRDMIDALIKNPGIGAVVLGIVLFVSGVTLTGNYAPDKEFLKEDDDSKDPDNLDMPNADTHCCSSSCIKEKVGALGGGITRVVSAFAPIMMLSVQFSYIYFIFDEAYSSYSGGVCPSYEISHEAFVPPYDGTPTKIRILMGFIGVYFTARTLSQMVAFLRALTERTVSNKDTARKTWFQTLAENLKCLFAWCGCCTQKNSSKGSASSEPEQELRISRLKGRECSRDKCPLQGFYYVSKKTDVVSWIEANMQVVVKEGNSKQQYGTLSQVEDDSDEIKQSIKLLKDKAIMEFGLSAFIDLLTSIGKEEIITVSLEDRRLKVLQALNLCTYLFSPHDSTLEVSLD